MKRTQTFEVGAGSFQLDIFTNDFFYTDGRKYFINRLFRNHDVKVIISFNFYSEIKSAETLFL